MSKYKIDTRLARIYENKNCAGDFIIAFCFNPEKMEFSGSASMPYLTPRPGRKTDAYLKPSSYEQAHILAAGDDFIAFRMNSSKPFKVPRTSIENDYTKKCGYFALEIFGTTYCVYERSEERFGLQISAWTNDGLNDPEWSNSYGMEAITAFCKSDSRVVELTREQKSALNF